MFRSIPVSNKLCFDKQIKRNWRIHQQKLDRMRSNLSKERSQQFTFLQTGKKRNVLQDIKNRQVERSNHILLNKIKTIQRNGCKQSYTNNESPKTHSKMLHEPFRKRELVRIVSQNQQMIRRIKDKRSAYNVRKMQQQRKQIQKNISLISQFPYKNYPITHTKVNFYVREQSQHLQGSKISTKQQSCQKQQNQKRCHTSQKVTRSSHYFYQCNRTLNQKLYVITTYLNKGIFYVEVENLENHLEKYRMEMTQSQVDKFLNRFYQDSVKLLVQNLDVNQQTEACYLNFNQNKHAKQTQNTIITDNCRFSNC